MSLSQILTLLATHKENVTLNVSATSGSASSLFPIVTESVTFLLSVQSCMAFIWLLAVVFNCTSSPASCPLPQTGMWCCSQLTELNSWIYNRENVSKICNQQSISSIIVCNTKDRINIYPVLAQRKSTYLFCMGYLGSVVLWNGFERISCLSHELWDFWGCPTPPFPPLTLLSVTLAVFKMNSHMAVLTSPAHIKYNLEIISVFNYAIWMF